MRKVLLSIAGFDPSGGAGVLLDIRVFQELGFHGAAVLTALTVQDSTAVRDIHPVSASRLQSQYRALSRDFTFAGLKVGMAATAENLAAIGRILARHPDIPRVVDPIIRSTSGAWLLEKNAVGRFCAAIRGRATVMTPNLDEAGRLRGSQVRTVAEMDQAARFLYDRTLVPCLVKGGHLAGAAVNVLFDGRRTHLFGRKRLGKDVHGTGCFFSAALAAYLARGEALARAAHLATEFTRRGIRTAVSAGRGRAFFSL